jgi:hypothetical protein
LSKRLNKVTNKQVIAIVIPIILISMYFIGTGAGLFAVITITPFITPTNDIDGATKEANCVVTGSGLFCNNEIVEFQGYVLDWSNTVQETPNLDIVINGVVIQSYPNPINLGNINSHTTFFYNAIDLPQDANAVFSCCVERGSGDALQTYINTFGHSPVIGQEVIVPIDVIKLDTDGDGIADEFDDCPTVFGSGANNGCPDPNVDTDGDGVIDSNDSCPTQPETINGFEDTDGCPDTIETPNVDTDGDGVTDSFDSCPNEFAMTSSGCPEQVDCNEKYGLDGTGSPNGNVNSDGCACEFTDSNGGTGCDGDGGFYAHCGVTQSPNIDDARQRQVCIDQCNEATDGLGVWSSSIIFSSQQGASSYDPLDPTNPNGYTWKNGRCEVDTNKDTDGDGINDIVDLCPRDAENNNGFEDFDGCPYNAPIVDSDGDGIHDGIDDCPSVGGIVDTDGCPFPDAELTTKTCLDGRIIPIDASCFVALDLSQQDIDGDGITDDVDQCQFIGGNVDPNTGCPFEDNTGSDCNFICQLFSQDTDGDGVIDLDDLCPTTIGVAENAGCPANTGGSGTPPNTGGDTGDGRIILPPTSGIGFQSTGIDPADVPIVLIAIVLVGAGIFAFIIRTNNQAKRFFNLSK